MVGCEDLELVLKDFFNLDLDFENDQTFDSHKCFHAVSACISAETGWKLKTDKC